MTVAADDVDGLREFFGKAPDLVLLDVAMPTPFFEGRAERKKLELPTKTTPLGYILAIPAPFGDLALSR